MFFLAFMAICILISRFLHSMASRFIAADFSGTTVTNSCLDPANILVTVPP